MAAPVATATAGAARERPRPTRAARGVELLPTTPPFHAQVLDGREEHPERDQGRPATSRCGRTPARPVRAGSGVRPPRGRAEAGREPARGDRVVVFAIVGLFAAR